MGLLSLLGSNPYVTGVKLALLVVAVGAVVGYVGLQRHAATVAMARAVAAERALSDYQAAAAAVIAERLRAQAAEAERVAEVSKNTEKVYADKIIALRAHYAGWVRPVSSQTPAAVTNSGAAVPESATTPGGVDAAPAVIDPVDRFVRELQSCDEDREKLRALQDWTKESR